MKSKSGFTLVELLVVISIVSMLASIAMVRISLAQANARDATRTQQVRQIDLATQLYVENYKKTPPLRTSGCDAVLASGIPTETQASACFAVSTATLESNPTQYNNWLAFKEALDPFIKVPDDPCAGNCVSASDFPIGYTYVAPLAMQYFCSTTGTCTAADDTYQIYAPMERRTVPSGSHGATGDYFSMQPKYMLSINASGVTIAASDNRGTDYGGCGDGCDVLVTKNAQVTLVATPSPVGAAGTIEWQEPCVATPGTSPCSFQVTEDEMVVGASRAQDPTPEGPDTTPPSVPQAVSAVLVGQWPDLGILLTWSASTDTGSGVTGYKIPENGELGYGNYDENGVFVPISPIPGTTRTMTAPQWAMGTNRCYTVIAYDAAGNQSEPSAGGCVDIPMYYALSTPVNLVVTPAGPAANTLSWDPSVGPEGASITYYVRKEGFPEYYYHSTDVPSYYARGASYGWIAPYCWTVRAEDSANGFYSDRSEVSCVPAP